ncbi:MAG: cation transporter, partial [Shewanella sp.]
MAQIRLYVPDMRCAGCVAKIEKVFAAQQAVEARVNLADKQVTVNGHISLDASVAVLASVGFTAQPIIDAKAAATAKQLEDASEYRLRLTQAIAALSIGGLMMLWGVLG